MFTHPNLSLTLGPPGTGKTTRLLDILDRELGERGVAPDRIAYVSFTRKAAYEARDRALERFTRYSEDDFRWFRTLHSLAYGVLGLSKDDVFTRSARITLGKKLGLYIGGAAYHEDGTPVDGNGAEPGTIMLNTDNLARSCCVPLEEAWRRNPDARIEWIKQEWFSKNYSAYKTAEGLLDYTDMIERFNTSNRRPDLEVVIVDEAQDLHRLQWLMLERLTAEAKRVYVAGDDDQAIFEWAGADVAQFLALEPKQSRVLEHSYRLPRSIHALANGIAGRISRRNAKTWSPRPDDGTVELERSLLEIELSNTQDTLLLVRNTCYIEDLISVLESRGCAFTATGYKGLDEDEVAVIKAWESLRTSTKTQLSTHIARELYRWLPSGAIERGYKNFSWYTDDMVLDWRTLAARGGLALGRNVPWWDAMTLMPEHRRLYYRALAKVRGGHLPERANVSVRTIHGVKGGEADHVVLFLDMVRRSYVSLEKDPDPEHRVWYVGATRARERLTLVPAGEGYGYPLGAVA